MGAAHHVLSHGVSQLPQGCDTGSTQRNQASLGSLQGRDPHDRAARTRAHEARVCLWVLGLVWPLVFAMETVLCAWVGGGQD